MKSIIALVSVFFSFSALAYDAICISNNPNLRTRVSHTEVRGGYTEHIELFEELNFRGVKVPRGSYFPFDDVERELVVAGNNISCDEGAYLRAKFDANYQLELSVICKNDSGPTMTLLNLKLDCM